MPRKQKGEFASRGATLSVRITKDTRRRLDAAAQESGNSLTSEVEARLRRTFEADDTGTVRNFGTAQTYAVLRLAAEAIKQVEALAGVRWYRSRFVHAAVVEAVGVVLSAYRPKGKTVAPPTFPVMAALDAFPEHRRAVRAGLANKPWGAVVARGCIAIAQAPGDGSQGNSGVYTRIASDLGSSRLTKPVLPLPLTTEEQAHNARVTSRKGEVK